MDRQDKQDEKIDLVSDIVIKHDQQVKELSSRIIDLEKRSMSKDLVISGIKENKDENCHPDSSEFFRQQMRIT